MQNNFCSSYATVLFDLALKNNLDTAYESVQKIIKKIDNNDSEFYDFICNLSIEKEIRKDEINKTLNKVIDQQIIYFIWAIIDFNRVRQLPKILKLFLKKYTEYKNIKYVKAISAYPLNPEELKILQKTIEKKFQKEIILENKVEPKVIGGLKIETDTWSFDNTFKTKLENIKKDKLNLLRKE